MFLLLRTCHRLSIVCLLAASAWAQQTTPVSANAQDKPELLGRATGKFRVNGVEAPGFRNIYSTENVDAYATTHVRLVNYGNSVIFSPSTKFHAVHNGFELAEGDSKVTSYTGMTAHLPHCYAVMPVDPNYMTLYEVQREGENAYVYAHSSDVRIRYWAETEPKAADPKRGPTREWIVREGQTARIHDLPLCKPLVDIWPQPNLATAAELGAATGFFVSIPFWGSNMSSLSPKN
jgi:hypothetical protein